MRSAAPALPQLDRSLVRPVLRDLHVVRAHRTLAWWLLDWAMIAAAVVAAERLGGWAAPIAVVVVAARQHALMVVMHEACHRTLLADRRRGVLVANLFASLPLLIDTRVFAAHHLQHHAHLNGPRDPDFVRKDGRPEWTFPMPRARLLRTYRRFLLLGGACEWVAAVYYFSGLSRLRGPRAARDGRAMALKLAYWSVAFGGVVALGGGWLLVKYWLVPFVLVLPVLIRVRSVAEHFGLARDHELTSTRNVLAGPVERFLFAPHNIGVHLVHHLDPAVPWFHLREAHARLARVAEYDARAATSRAYLWPVRGSVWRALVRG